MEEERDSSLVEPSIDKVFDSINDNTQDPSKKSSTPIQATLDTNFEAFPEREQTDSYINNPLEFSLDIVTSNMDFEQAYLAYTTLQQKQAINAVELLKRVQMLNNQYDSYAPAFNSFPGNSGYQFKQDVLDDAFMNLTKERSSNSFEENATQEPQVQSTQNKSSGRTVDEFDHFFSSTESDALERFLDNLANPGVSKSENKFEESKKLQMQLNEQSYTYQMSSSSSLASVRLESLLPLDQLYGLAPATPQKQLKKETFQKSIHDTDLSDVFSHYPPYDGKNIVQQQQLPTPGERSTPKRPFEDDLQELQNKRRLSTKQLLSFEQKRLNHLHSEQKRRQLCKLAYERCLRLIVDVDEYARINLDKTVRRKHKLKNGLPNISKHTALVKLSEELLLIRGKNDALKRLLMD